MNRQVFRYTFGQAVPMSEVEETLLLAVMVVESLHGATAVRLESSYVMDIGRRVCVIDASYEIGRSICRVFTGLLSREIGDHAYSVERAHPRQAEALATAA